MNEIKIEDYLHLYLGCECRVSMVGSNSRFLEYEGDKILEPLDLVEALRGDMFLKLRLRPLSDLTEEEMKEFVLIDLNIKNTLKKVSLVFEATKIYYETTGLVGNGHMDLIRCSSDQFFYLLKQGFDLFGLIPKKLAINKLTVTSKD